MNKMNIEPTILDLDAKIHELKNQQNFSECLNLIEKNIGLKSEAYGKKSKEVKNFI
jgi:hypothetical protein